MNIRFVLSEVGTDLPKQAGVAVCQVQIHPITPAAVNNIVRPQVFCKTLNWLFFIKSSAIIHVRVEGGRK